MRDERPQELVRSIAATCKRCHEVLTIDDDWSGYIVGRSYGFSHCGLVQTTKAMK